jgi:branched-subunit amino acid aminotransferase/4-amino-4-deoxychorismate lyase
LERLISAEEIFLCNSIQGIQWVEEIESKRFYKKEIAEQILGEINKDINPF